MRRFVPILMLLFALLPAMVRAAASETAEFIHDQFKVALDVSAPTAIGSDKLVSGTNVGVGFAPRLLWRNDPSFTRYDKVRFQTLELKVGTDWVYATTRPPGGGGGGMLRGGPGGGGAENSVTPVLDPPSEWQPFEISDEPAWWHVPAFRFASTHFADGASVALEFRCTYDLIKNEAVVETVMNSVVLTVKTYNRVLAWKTTRDENPQTPFLYQDIVDAVMSEGHKAFTAAKYATEPLALGPDLLNHPQISDHAGTATAWFADTHGNSTGLQDSGWFTGNSATTSPGQFKTWPTWAQTAHPLKLAIVAAYACATMNSTNTIKQQVPLRIAPENWVDGVYVGSFTKIYAETYANPDPDPDAPPRLNYPLNEHARVFFDALASGMTVRGAVDAANADAHEHLKNDNLKMEILGDPLMTLTDVYLTLAERSKIGIGAHAPSGRWYYSGGN